MIPKYQDISQQHWLDPSSLDMNIILTMQTPQYLDGVGHREIPVEPTSGTKKWGVAHLPILAQGFGANSGRENVI